MAISEDREIGIGQSTGKLWDNVAKEHNLKRHKNTEQCLAKDLQSRYATIVKDVTKFCSIYQQVEKIQESSTNDEDMVSKAKSLFKDSESKDLNLYIVREY